MLGSGVIVAGGGSVFGVPIRRDVNAGITASITQSQGQGALTAEVNEVSTVANVDDTVTLPTAVAGLKIIIINKGVSDLQIFPASGDDLGEEHIRKWQPHYQKSKHRLD